MASTDTWSLEKVGERLRQRRRELGLSQQELSQRIQSPQSWISEVENGKRPHLEAETVFRFCQALNISSDYLLGITNTITNTRPQRPRGKRSAASEAEDTERDAVGV